MGIFEGLFKSKEDPLQKQADTLVSAAAINATSVFVPLLDKFPFLGKADVVHWDFIVTIAGVFMGASCLANLHVGVTREKRLMETVSKHLEKKYQDGIHAFEDCKGFYESEYDRLAAAGHDPKFLASDAVGKWIMWNVLGRAPESHEECMLARIIGGMVIHAFFDWWK